MSAQYLNAARIFEFYVADNAQVMPPIMFNFLCCSELRIFIIIKDEAAIKPS